MSQFTGGTNTISTKYPLDILVISSILDRTIIKHCPSLAGLTDIYGIDMAEIRVTVSEKMDKVLEKLVDTGMFSSKADLVRYATIAYVKDLGWFEKPSSK